MAFDGITVAAIVKECNDLLVGGRITKIAQPESDELLLTLKASGGQYRLLLSASASLPLIYFTSQNKPSPMTAPGFCMLLRKHLANGRIVSITQPGLERIMEIRVEHLNEMGDLCQKRLIIEVMGKHSNIIFCDTEGKIIDSIKHISGMVSSVREVLPGRDYFIPKTDDKTDPLDFYDAPDKELFYTLLSAKNMPLYKAIYCSFTGLSPLLAQELCYVAGLDSDRHIATFEEPDFPAKFQRLYEAFLELCRRVAEGDFAPVMVLSGNTPKEYAAVPLTSYGNALQQEASISALLESFYARKNAAARIRQKSADLRKIVQTALERNIKKYDLQLQQIKDTEKREKYKVYGELLHTYGYSANPGDKSIEVENYYTGEMLTIPLDETLTVFENAKRHFDKYGKMKRTYETLSTLIIEVKAEIDHLESISTALDIAEAESDLTEIKEELITSGYIRRKGGAKREKITSKPFHYVSRDGFHIYVGKNNLQNDALTFKFAGGSDWWFHAKGIPGSHVVLKCEGKDVPDGAFEDAARLAAHYSKGREQEKVEIDYIERKHVKKPAGAKPGFVVYYTNYSMMIDSDISGLTQVSD